MASHAPSLAVPPLQKRKRIPMRVIRALVQHIAETADPDEIILFGSHAYGKPEAWSDVDLLVVKDIPEGEEIEAAIGISRALPEHYLALDLLVRSRAMINRRIEMGDRFMRDIITQGKRLYARNP